MSSQESLYAFRDFASHLFRHTMASMRGNHAEIQSSYDKTLDKVLEMMERPEEVRTNTNPNVIVEKTNPEKMNANPPRLHIREIEPTLFEPSPVSSRDMKNMPTMWSPSMVSSGSYEAEGMCIGDEEVIGIDDMEADEADEADDAEEADDADDADDAHEVTRTDSNVSLSHRIRRQHVRFVKITVGTGVTRSNKISHFIWNQSVAIA